MRVLHKVPQLVVQVATVSELQALVRLASEHQVPLTFRAAGTSLGKRSVTRC